MGFNQDNEINEMSCTYTPNNPLSDNLGLLDKLRSMFEEFTRLPSLEGRKELLLTAESIFGRHSPWFEDLRQTTIKILENASLP